MIRSRFSAPIRSSASSATTNRSPGPQASKSSRTNTKSSFPPRTRNTAKAQARFILVSPIAFEDSNDPLLPDGRKENENLNAYATATADVARELQHRYVDVFTGTAQEFSREPGAQYTLSGFQINEAGDRLVGELLDRALFGSPNPLKPEAELFGKVRAAVNDKSWVHQQDYRMLNGWYVYGSRRAPYDVDTFPEEYKKIRAMAAVRDEFIWNLVRGKAASASRTIRKPAR